MAQYFEICQGLRVVFRKPFLATCVFRLDRGLRFVFNVTVVEDLLRASKKLAPSMAKRLQEVIGSKGAMIGR